MSVATPTRQLTRTTNRWLYVVSAAIALLVSGTTLSLLFSVITPSLTKEYGWTRGEISTGYAIESALAGIGSLVLGFLIDKYGPRMWPKYFAILWGAGIAAIAIVPNNLGVFYALCVLISFGATVGTPLVHSVVINAWFARRRGFALAIVNVAVGLCGVLMPFVLSALNTSLGWRGAVAVTGLLMGGVPFIVFAFIHRMPPAFDEARITALSRSEAVGEPLWHVIRRSRQFWFLLVAIFCVAAATFGVLTQLILIVTDTGAALPVALGAASLLSLSSLITRLVAGALLDVVWAPIISAIAFAIAAVGVVLVVVAPSSQFELYIGVILLGIGLGTEGDVMPYLVSRYFPALLSGRIISIMWFIYFLGISFGTLLLSWTYSLSGAYGGAGWILVALLAVAVILVLGLGRYKFAADVEASIPEPLVDEEA